ncbi:MexH family multidrug efflux RND transporter periplasmic adaptor subunit [Neiella marina]|uniref:MexH family multidrug efflux RND transporter periplasmic adaptor subunit n=1 Tax=Neiella marina TaxID=508461 RepID=A0A8J2U677_9GAMM|nr:efflux RND transporter periplasmic adaptor subunit [Neiella marina]GGA81496.1 MexH family multidrug efflux RND transporter periplasmic adaptor subunit [Neiella marina]
MRLTTLVCGVTLIAAGSWLALSSDSAEASLRQQSPAVSVRVKTLDKASIAESIPLQGTVFSHHAVDITPEVDGRITAVEIESGQRVKQGQLLIQLDDRHQQANVSREQAKLQDDLRHQQQIRQLFDQQAVSETEVDRADAQVAIQQAELQLAKAALADRAIRAPFAGTIGLVDLSLGQLVNSDSVLTTLDDTSVLKLNASVPAKYQHRIRLGSRFMLSTNKLHGHQVEAKLAYMDTRVRETTLNLRLQLVIDNANGYMLPGSFLTGNLPLADEAVLSMPLQAVAYEGHQRFAYRLSGDYVEKVEIELGARNADEVEVIDGLNPGDAIVTEGLVKLNDGTRVLVIEQTNS